MNINEDKPLDSEDIESMEKIRIERMDEAGINELDVIGQARENLNIWENYFNENMTRGKDDMNFLFRDQWTAIERSEFNRLQKVCFTFNKLMDPFNKIIGEQRKNKPDLIVRSLTGNSNQEEINLRADLVRTISYQSQNDLVYQTAFKSALAMGWGGFQIDIDYESPKTFNQIIKYLLIPDIRLTSFDPMAIKPHKADGDYCSRQYLFSKEQFAANFPYILNPVSYADPRMLLDFQWETRDTISVCDYYIKEWYSFKLLKLSNNSFVSENDWKKMQKNIKIQKEIANNSSEEVKNIIEMEIPKIIGERQSQDYTIMHYRLIKDRIIDFRKWPSKYLPIIFVDGNSHFIEGRQYTHSFIHEARDAQKFINYVGSEIATEIKNRRREQWLGTPDNIIGYEQNWRNPETQMGILTAKPDPKTGQMPIKQPPWQLSQELMMEMQRGSQDMREILGFNEQQDMQGKDISGKARRERKLEGSMAAYVFYDNLSQAIEQSGRVVLDLLPSIIGEDERYMTISKKDGKTSSIVLNKKERDGSISNQVKQGDFDVEINTGPSFSVQKEVALEFFQETLQANPQVFNLIADLWAKNLDVQYMDQIVERFQTLVPPEILAKEKGEQPPPPQPNPQQQMMEMEMKVKQQELQERAEELSLRGEKHKIEQAELLMKAKKLAADMNMDVQDREIDMHKADLDYSAKIAKVIADIHKSSSKENNLM